MLYCQNCGAKVAPRAIVCRECGSDAETGWSQEADSTGYADPGLDDFDYDAYLEREHGVASGRRRWKRWWLKKLRLAR